MSKLTLPEWKRLATGSVQQFGCGFIFVEDGEVEVRGTDAPRSEQNKCWARVPSLPAHQIPEYVEHLRGLGCSLSTDLQSKGWR